MWLRAVLGLHIGAALRIERRLERDDLGAEALGHRLDDGIAADAQRLRQYFGRQMTVAQVPRDARQRQRLGARISASGSGSASTSTMRPSSRRKPSPPRSIAAPARSSKNSSPPTAVMTTRRR